MQIQSKDEHYDLFSKPKEKEIKRDVGRYSENTGLYKKYVPVPVTLDFIKEYFKFEERKRKGFSSPFLTKNPYENHFASFIEDFEEQHKHLSPESLHLKLLAALEIKHKEALASLG